MKIRTDLAHLAKDVMQERGLLPEFSKEAMEQLSHIQEPAPPTKNHKDLSSLPWCSIDNDDSRDLDQLTYAEKTPDGKFTLWIAVADVSGLVAKNTPIDQHAQANTTSVYTPAKIFPMLPEKLSTNLTSLNEHENRNAMVVKLRLNPEGEVVESSIFQALVYNRAQLTYNGIGAWLDGKKPLPDKVENVSGLEKALKIQHEAAQILKKRRHAAGALTLVSPEPEVHLSENDNILIELTSKNFAHQLIEEFMVAANKAVAEHFRDAHILSLRRVVRTPKHWDEIVEIAENLGESLPTEPDAKALDEFLIRRKQADRDSFPDLSLAVIKLLGRGEYVVENDPEHTAGHFALAVSFYTHSTAPNRRFPDLISQRQYKAFIAGEKFPYTPDELRALATHCTAQEDAATKVQRQLNKSAAGVLLSSQIGKVFQGIVAGVTEKGTWVRLFNPAVDGKIIRGAEMLKVGQKISVQLKRVDIKKGFLDFVCVSKRSY